MTPPIQRLADDVLLLTGDAVAALRYTVRVALAARHRNGLPIPGILAELAAATSGAGQSDIETKPAQQDSNDMIDTMEAARMLGCSNRQVRRLAPQLGGRIIAGRWLLERTAVTEHIQGRRTA
ncbi:hypothetical protein [Rhodococcus ruber]|uniref:hypothetical protein n=1 Tax=Rhodococcus ruber TaxID=1830 RepID=UPI001F439A3C|nr:hypothetical protein [Rhodococcus ruber]MCF8781246.1 hypothetical protein [Rhodococcus ruber]